MHAPAIKAHEHHPDAAIDAANIAKHGVSLARAERLERVWLFAAAMRGVTIVNCVESETRRWHSQHPVARRVQAPRVAAEAIGQPPPFASSGAAPARN